MKQKRWSEPCTPRPKDLVYGITKSFGLKGGCPQRGASQRLGAQLAQVFRPGRPTGTHVGTGTFHPICCMSQNLSTGLRHLLAAFRCLFLFGGWNLLRVRRPHLLGGSEERSHMPVGEKKIATIGMA